MADLPRWINSSKVDTQHWRWPTSSGLATPEVWSRDLSWRLPASRGEQHEKLPTIVHWFEDIGPPKVNERMCTDPQRQRCWSGRGGYQFRWYSALWYGWISSAPAVPGLGKVRRAKEALQKSPPVMRVDPEIGYNPLDSPLFCQLMSYDLFDR